MKQETCLEATAMIQVKVNEEGHEQVSGNYNTKGMLHKRSYGRAWF